MPELNLVEMSDEELFGLRNDVNAEADRRVAKATLHNNLVNVLAGADSDVEADAAYAAAKAEVFTS